ncbi:sigma-70 family RNA polymerase sigma factor [Actinomadura miaoliensis]|uniref:Sigma-70 family RNA polymerase sigma factor n=1 Tax=Actinomadura miaoliensis TaxID=430685 RepID=A0ABP7X3B1_9ACTN
MSERDRAELNALYEAEAPGLYAWLRRRTRDGPRAEDLVQATFEKAVENWGDLREAGPERRRRWLYTTAYRRMLDELDRADHARVVLTSDYAGVEPRDDTVEREVVGGLVLAEFRRAIDGLSPRRRQAAELRWLHDRSNREIAGALGVSEGRVSQLLKEARVALREAAARAMYAGERPVLQREGERGE